MSTSIRNPESQPDHFTVRLILTFFSLAAILLSIFAWNTIGQSTQPGLEMVLININHGDSILLRSTKGETVLIDAGYPDAGTLKYLNEHTVKHLDLLIVTHHDEDHIGGIPEVLRALEVDTYIENGQVIDTDYFYELDKALQETGVRRKTVRTGDRIPFGELTLEVWNPSRARPDVVNNNSIVLFLQVGKVRFLLTGDIETPIEERLINSNRDLRVHILKVAHHAGNTSSSPAFLEAVKPKIAVYSASNNFPGFPNEDTIDLLRIAGAKVYGTNFNGTITINTDGKTYSISTETGQPLLPY